ncbi:syntaxin-6 [Colias croceus]|uniref:syntaxin-6 n=1 Tax=Colias crocea TaxID=72248 RepID=UPI001E27F262|nr:syntaxin-6 [Colias croceus]
MTLEDPFYVVKDEVFRALNKTRGLYLRWQELSTSPILPNSAEVEWTSIELRNALRSIEWDLEDLEDTISIAEKNSSKFKIDNKEICDRRSFIEATKQEVKLMKNKMSMNKNRDSDGTAREPLLRDGSPTSFRNMNWTSTPKYSQYSKLASQTDSPNRFDNFENDLLQEGMMMSQDEQLAMINNSVGSLKTVSTHIGMELDEQAMMLDDLNSELENTDSKLYTTVVKISKVLHINNDGRQWFAIILLLCILVVILVLFIIL